MKLSAVLILILILLVRIYQSWPLSPKEQLNFDSITDNFMPVRDNLASQIREIVPGDQGALLVGILLGSKKYFSKELNEVLINTSTIHIAVVSGQNLSLLVGFVMTGVSWFGRKKTILLALVVSLIYALLTGFGIPTIRALIMVTLSLGAQLVNREAKSLQILLITALMMLIISPNWLLSISFQLSFLATLAVVEVAPKIVSSLSFLPDIIKQDLGVSLAAQLLTLPVIAANFHQLSLLGILTNTLVLWTVSLIMLSGIITLFSLLLGTIIGSICSLIPTILLTYFLDIVRFFNSLDFNTITVGRVALVVWIGYYLLILGIYLKLKGRNVFDKLNKQ